MIRVVCANCAVEFKNYTSNRRKYCCRRCYELGKRCLHTRQCEYCQQFFPTKHKHARFCSHSCAAKYYVKPGSQTGFKSSSWKGGEFVSADGYTMVLVPGLGKYRTQQSIRMEELLDRSLTSNEVAHHRDGDKRNNSPSNLQLMTRGEHMLFHNPRAWESLKKEIKGGKK